jgi:hypothetical protein
MGGRVLVTADGNLATARVGDLAMVSTGDRPISDEAWREHLEQLGSWVKRHGPAVAILCYVPKHGPSVEQRRVLAEDYGQHIRIDCYRRNALLSESVIVRGILTAIGWLTSGNMKVKTWPPKQVENALTWLAEEARFDRQEVLDALGMMIQAMSGEAKRSAL